MNLFNNLSISNKLLIILLLVSVIPLFIVTFGFYRLGKGRLTEQTIRILEVQAKNVNATVERYVNYKFKHIYKLAKMSELIFILRTNEEARPRIVSHAIASFQARLRIDPDFLSISLFDKEGGVVFSTDAIIHGNYATRHFFIEAAKGRNFVSEPCVDGGIAGIYFSIPVKQANKILGVATLRCRAEEFWELFEHESGRVGQGNAVILSNSDGVRIAHSTKMDLIFKSWAPLNPGIREQILQERRYGSDITDIASTDIPEVLDVVMAVSPPRYFQHRLVIGKETYHSALRVMDNGWRIICTIPETTFLGPVHANIFYMSIISGVIVCVVVVASLIIGRLSTKRINTFVAISKEVANGDFSKEVPFTYGDEIGQLGKAFNVMIGSIKRMIEQLKDINAVALEIHSHIEIEQLLQDLVNTSKRMIDAEFGVLALLDETGETIKYFKVAMPNPSEPCPIKEQPEGKGLLGMVMKNGQTIRLDNVANNPASVSLPLNHPPMHTLLGVPIKIDQKVVGGLLLANKVDGGRFTLRDEETLLTITYQAAVAIENAKLYDEVRRLAITDGLTGLLNHNEFYRRLNEHIEGSKRYQYAVSLLMIDIDHFKHFNDTYGHQVGDYVLKVISDIIKAQTRAVDVCARYGGEEFAVILRESDAPYASILSERIRSTVCAYPFKHEGVRTQLSVSVGVAYFPKDADNAKDLIKMADEALYTAKRSGRNKVCVSTPLNQTDASGDCFFL